MQYRLMLYPQAFVAIILMASWMDPGFGNNRSFDVVELFAGKARVARLASARGWYAICHDWDYDDDYQHDAAGRHNAMDLCGSAGFLHLDLTVIVITFLPELLLFIKILFPCWVPYIIYCIYSHTLRTPK